jgi:hypothetical protein
MAVRAPDITHRDLFSMALHRYPPLTRLDTLPIGAALTVVRLLAVAGAVPVLLAMEIIAR